MDKIIFLSISALDKIIFVKQSAEVVKKCLLISSSLKVIDLLIVNIRSEVNPLVCYQTTIDFGVNLLRISLPKVCLCIYPRFVFVSSPACYGLLSNNILVPRELKRLILGSLCCGHVCPSFGRLIH